MTQEQINTYNRFLDEIEAAMVRGDEPSVNAWERTLLRSASLWNFEGSMIRERWLAVFAVAEVA